MKQKYWIIRDEASGKLIAKHPSFEFRDVSEVYEEYRHLPDAFTIEVKSK